MLSHQLNPADRGQNEPATVGQTTWLNAGKSRKKPPDSIQVKAERMERQLYYSVVQCPTGGARLHFLSDTSAGATVLVLATKLVLQSLCYSACATVLQC